MNYLGLLAPAAVASQPDALEAELAAIVRILPGYYAGAADDSAAAHEGRPIRHKIARIHAPQFGELVFYYQLGSASFDGEALQQKLFVFDTDPDRSANRMQPFVILAGSALIDLERRPEQWTELEPASMMQFPDACAFVWTRDGDSFVGRVRRSDCAFTSKAFGQVIRPDMYYRVSSRGLDWSETLYGEGATPVVSTGGEIQAQRRQ